MNSVVLIGRLTADPQTHAGEKHESATFRLAVPARSSRMPGRCVTAIRCRCGTPSSWPPRPPPVASRCCPEDLSDGESFGDVTVVNPLRHDPA